MKSKVYLKRGFSLIEAVVALMVSSIFICCLLSLVNQSQLIGFQADRRLAVLSEFNRQMQEATTIPVKVLLNGGSYSSPGQAGGYEASTNYYESWFSSSGLNVWYQRTNPAALARGAMTLGAATNIQTRWYMSETSISGVNAYNIMVEVRQPHSQADGSDFILLGKVLRTLEL